MSATLVANRRFRKTHEVSVFDIDRHDIWPKDFVWLLTQGKWQLFQANGLCHLDRIYGVGKK